VLKVQRLRKLSGNSWPRQYASLRNGERGMLGLDIMDDSAFVKLSEELYLTLTIDSFTVNPLFFEGGSIGKLAADGTISDLVVSGAKPIALFDAIVAEEGIEFDVVERAVSDMIEEAKLADVAILGGDFKVMLREEISKMVITTAGFGLAKHPITDNKIVPGNKILMTGSIGEHGAVIAAHQYGLELRGDAKSDASMLIQLLPAIDRYADQIHAARDPTRGGVAMVLNDWATDNNVKITIDEKKIPIKDWVKGISDALGLDPLSLASEGRAVIAVSSEVADDFLEFLKKGGFPDAEIIGEVAAGRGEVLLKTAVGGLRIVPPPSGVIVPRIC